MIKKLVVVGVGLIGGSLAAALKQRHACEQVIGVVRREETARAALASGLIDEASFSLAELMPSLQRGDMVFLAVPTLTVNQTLEELKACWNTEVTVTDGASVKGSVEQAAVEVFGRVPENFVLGHPIAGSEKSGVTAADPDLYDKHRIILTPQAHIEQDHISRVRAMWQAVGAEVLEMAVWEHDEVLAATSHLPHVIAYSLVDTLAHDSENENIFRYAAGGFRDFTRIASSDPVMWHDIMVANREAILKAIDMFTNNLAGLRQSIAAQNSEEMLDLFTRSKKARDHFSALLEQSKTLAQDYSDE